ncbi:AraC family transcriptional regulator [Modestobacter lapidis]|nr:AraC family transcriptional regulator [Modestobacter lapidis]
MTLAPLPLHRFPLCRSSDVHEFAARLNSVYYPATVVPGASRRFPGTSVLHAVHTPDFTLGYIRPGGDVEVTPVEDTTTYHVNLALSGSLTAVSGSDEVTVRPGHASVHSPRRTHVLRARAGSELIGLKLSRELVEGELGALLGRPVTGPVRLAPSFDLRNGAGRSWLALAQLIMTEVDRPGLLDGALVRKQYMRTLVAGLLTAQRHELTDALRGAETPLRPRTLRRALDHLHAHFDEPLTVPDLAVAAGCSVRRLQESFAEHLGIAPMTHLRTVRLDAARRQLAEGSGTVTEVAQRCGFTHLGRFSAAYRERFGELPSRTLGGAAE